MPGPAKVAFFDVDGVLLDSLPQHLALCREYAGRFGLNLSIPPVEDFRGWVSQGKKVSPMRKFFLAVGFPESIVDQATRDYDREFSKKYPSPPFPGVGAMLEQTARDGWELGLVTSNTQGNVESALGECLDFFRPELRFYHEPDGPSRSKTECLVLGARLAGVAPADCVFVGDQPADQQAAHEAGMPFLGVTYGWGILPGAAGIVTARNAAEIPQKLEQALKRTG